MSFVLLVFDLKEPHFSVTTDMFLNIFLMFFSVCVCSFTISLSVFVGIDHHIALVARDDAM
jgi:hypothetical protein